MEAIKYSDNDKTIILEAFNKYINIVKDPKEFNEKLSRISSDKVKSNYLEYTAVLFMISEFYDLLPKDTDWEYIIHQYMIEIKKGIEEDVSYLSPSLFSGLSEFGYSIYNVYKRTGSYEKFLITLNKHILKQVNFLLDKYEENIGNMQMTAYDSIYGFAGQGSYLLFFKDNEEVRNVLERIIRLFIEMSKSIEVKGHKVPGWYIPRDMLSTDVDKEMYEEGSFNLALSHGISGPLAFMSLALSGGIEVDGQKEAMNNILKELLRFSFKAEDGNVYWGGRLSFKEYINGRSESQKANRQSWCYGSIGIARAMYLAGRALNDKKIIEFASNILEGIADMDVKQLGLNCDHICHGHAGVLAIMEVMYKDTQNPKYKVSIDKVVNHIVKGFDSNSLFGFYNYTTDPKDEKDENGRVKFKFVDDPSFLEGSEGAILALMTSLYPENNSWMRHLVID